MKNRLGPSVERERSFHRLTAIVLALGAAALSASAAHAEEGREDATRFRGGLQAELGPAVFVGKADASVVAGLTGHVGVQLGETLGVLVAPQVQGFMGEQSGPYVGMAILGDLTFDDAWAVGLGPEIGVLAPEGDGPGPITSATVGLVGRLAVYPGADDGADGRRSGVAVGLDLHARFYGHAYAACGGCEQPYGPPLLLAPMFFIGHAAY